MADLLTGKVAVLTGASSGIARATALRFADEGAAAIVVADLRDTPREGGEPTHELIARDTAAEARFVRCDVTVVDELRAAVAAADAFGGLDVMVNSAGLFRAHDILDVTEADYDAMMDVNVKGTFFGCQAAARAMIAAGKGGSIVNLSSQAGYRGNGRYPTYNASKGAVRTLTWSLAKALGPHGIRVNSIHPGLVDTSMTTVDVPLLDERGSDHIPLGRVARAEDVAAAITYFASDLSAYISGSPLLVDGGELGSA